MSSEQPSQQMATPAAVSFRDAHWRAPINLNVGRFSPTHLNQMVCLSSLSIVDRRTKTRHCSSVLKDTSWREALALQRIFIWQHCTDCTFRQRKQSANFSIISKFGIECGGFWLMPRGRFIDQGRLDSLVFDLEGPASMMDWNVKTVKKKQKHYRHWHVFPPLHWPWWILNKCTSSNGSSTPGLIVFPVLHSLKIYSTVTLGSGAVN